jgi:hypothetical protein
VRWEKRKANAETPSSLRSAEEEGFTTEDPEGTERRGVWGRLAGWKILC